ncbi:MAG: DUF4426 domain-containing protein [Pseudomonadota bacterium]
MARRAYHLGFIIGLLALTACGGGGERTIPEAQSAAENSATFGDYTVHFHALSTDEVPAQVAREIGVVRARNRALLNVSVIRTTDQTPVTAEVTVKPVNLTGQLKNMTMREVAQADAIYYLGELTVANRETLIFDIAVTPTDETETFNVRTKRIYYTD